MFEIELNHKENAKEFTYHITICTGDARFKLIKEKFGYTLKVYTKAHIFDIISYLEKINACKKLYKMNFKIDEIKHFYYIGIPF